MRRVAPMWVCLLACGGSAGGADGGADGSATDASDPVSDFGHDIAATALVVDVGTREATAAITLAGPTASGWASLEIGDLEIGSVTGANGALRHRIDGARLDVEVPADLTITVAYRYRLHDAFDGVATAGYTLLWPYHCGNLFPCKSDPADGTTFTLQVNGVPEGQVAVHPAAIATQAPSYMIAWAIGEYTRIDLGTTGAGTSVVAWHLPGGESAATAGTDNLVAVVDWLEDTYGPYPFGTEVGSVSVGWGAGAYGGMEHHPLSHIATAAMADDETHAHEAAHGWFGDGIRIACWEDFVLSEGTVSYLAARALAAVAGSTAGEAVWTRYRQRLGQLQGTQPTWPAGCNQIDILADGLFSSAPYMRGAFFWRALELRLGAAEVDGALASFFAARAGTAATMQEMLDHVQAETGYDPAACAQSWLRDTTIPAADTPCP